jgi:hypothetical protein
MGKVMVLPDVLSVSISSSMRFVRMTLCFMSHISVFYSQPFQAFEKRGKSFVAKIIYFAIV